MVLFWVYRIAELLPASVGLIVWKSLSALGSGLVVALQVSAEVHAQAVTAFGGHAPAAQLLKLVGPLEFRLGFQPGALSPTPYAYVHPKPQKL